MKQLKSKWENRDALIVVIIISLFIVLWCVGMILVTL